jgi:WD40 repeat protein
MKFFRWFGPSLVCLAAALPARADGFVAMAVSPDGTKVAFGIRGVKLQTLQTGAMRKEFRVRANSGKVYSLAFSGDGKVVYCGDNDGEITEYPVPGAGQDGVKFKWHHGDVTAMAVSPDGAWMATGGEDKFITIWDLAQRKPLQRLETAGADLLSVAISPDGSRLAASDENGTVMTWDCASWRPLLKLATGDTVNSVIFSGDGRQLITGGNAESVQFWNEADGKLARELPREGEWVGALALSPDGRWLAAGGGQEWLRLWDLSSGKMTQPTRHQDRINAVAFSRDGTRLVTAGDDNAIHNLAFPIAAR